MVSVQRIAALRSLSAAHVAVEVIDETGSTNTDLLDRAPNLAAPVFLVATRQTQGRGRSGRVWLSEAGNSLTFSLAWKFTRPVGELSGLPLAVGVAVAQALETFDVRTALKWPNDIFKDGKKLGGVLVETVQVQNGTWAVIGVGLNLVLGDEIEAQIRRPAAEARWLAQLDRNTLLAALLNSLAESMTQFDREGMPGFAERWGRLHAHAGKKVSILHDDQVLLEGVAMGIDEWGHLLIDTDTGLRTVLAGEVSLIGKNE